MKRRERVRRSNIRGGRNEERRRGRTRGERKQREGERKREETDGRDIGV